MIGSEKKQARTERKGDGGRKILTSCVGWKDPKPSLLAIASHRRKKDWKKEPH